MKKFFTGHYIYRIKMIIKHVFNKYIFLAIIIGAFFWIFEAFIHYYFFGKKNFINVLIRPGRHELWMRFLVFSLFLSFAIYAGQVQKKLIKAHGRMEAKVVERTAELASANKDLFKAIMEYKQAEHKVKQEKIFCMNLLNQINEGIAAVNEDGEQFFVNDELCKITGFTRGELLSQKPPFKYWDEKNFDKITAAFMNALKGIEAEYELVFKRKDGKRFFALVNPKKTTNPDGSIMYFATVKDITDKKRIEEKLRRMAYFDFLTKLPNRKLFMDHVDQALAYAERSRKFVALLFLDIDGFKKINDTYGHEIGDLILQKTAGNLKMAIRKTDTAARIGGDEFAAVLTQLENIADIATIAKKILEVMSSNAFILKDIHLLITVSIGISVFPHDDTKISALLSKADSAMYYAKKTGVNQFRFYNKEIEGQQKAA